MTQKDSNNKSMAATRFRPAQADIQLWLSLQTAIEQFLTALPYYPCLLLVHPEIICLKQAQERAVHHYGWPVLSVGQSLSQSLLSVAPKRRPHMAPRAFTEAVQAYRPGPVLCTNIDLLLEPTLYLDPLRLVKKASRRTTLVVTWPGTFVDDVLAYATPEHAHYRTWSQPDLCDHCIVML